VLAFLHASRVARLPSAPRRVDRLH